jgi:hypothetical protein
MSLRAAPWPSPEVLFDERLPPVDPDPGLFRS